MTAIVMLGVFSICVLIGAPIGTAMCLSSVSALQYGTFHGSVQLLCIHQ